MNQLLRKLVLILQRSTFELNLIYSCLAEYGIGYAWNPQTITINAGDFVKVTKSRSDIPLNNVSADNETPKLREILQLQTELTNSQRMQEITKSRKPDQPKGRT